MVLVRLGLRRVPFLRGLLVHFQIGEKIADESVILVQFVAVGLLHGLGSVLLVRVFDKDVSLGVEKRRQHGEGMEARWEREDTDVKRAKGECNE